MNERRAMVKRFEENDRERLAKLFRQLGTDNPYEAEAARGRITSLLQQFNRDWTGLVTLLSTGRLTINPRLADDIVKLGCLDHDQRASARRDISELLDLHRKNWNDLVDALCSITDATWLDSRTPDPERVNPLGLIIHLLQDYVEFREPHECITVALWTLHTHVFDYFMVTPRLVLRSPVAGCAKTLLMDLLGKMVAKPDKFDSVTTSVIFHVIDESHPTLLIDEADNLVLALQPNSKMRAVFNSGHRKGGTLAIRENGETRRFQLFSPLALALPDTTGGLPRTLNSRCITVIMERADGRRKLLKYDANNPDPALDAIYRQILFWRRDLDALDPAPELPSNIRNRFADNWIPLISIADALGYGPQAREAMLKFAKEFQDADARITLLASIKKVFDSSGLDSMPSKLLLQELHALNDADWKEFLGIKGEQQPHRLKDSELAMLLRDFKIRSCTIWPLNRTPDSKSAKGYRRSQFEKVWRAYCTNEDDDTPANS